MSIFTSRPGSFGRPQTGWSHSWWQWWQPDSCSHASRILGETND